MLANDDIRLVVPEAARPLTRHALEHVDLLVIALVVMIALTALLLPRASGGLECGSRVSALIGAAVTRAVIGAFAVLVVALALLIVT